MPGPKGRIVRGALEALTDLLRVVDPGRGYVPMKIKQAREDRAKAIRQRRQWERETGQTDQPRYSENLGNTEGVTGYFKKPLNLDPQGLRNIRGAMGEEAFRETSPKLDWLKESIAKKGYDPSPVLIHVREDGVPFVFEGNTRILEAVMSGRESIPVEVKYLRGSQTQTGDLDMDTLQKLLVN
jgi:hypothetical protein